MAQDPPSPRVVHAFEVDGCLDCVTTPLDETVTIGARERLLRQQGALVGHRRTPLYWFGFGVFLAMCFALHPCVCAAMVFFRWYQPEDPYADHELEYLLKVYMCLLYAQKQKHSVVIVTRNTVANVQFFLRRVGWRNEIPILSDPSYAHEKPDMLRTWCRAQENDDASWVLHMYDAAEAPRLQEWADAHPDVRLHVVPVAHTRMTFAQCKRAGHVLPGLFHQTLPLQHLWDHLHKGVSTPLPPLFLKSP